MLKIRKSEDRGIYDWGWLQTSHTFSFARYYDPNFTGFRNLLVINEDIVAPSTGFEKHYHDNMEIITYVMKGELEHQDNLGNKYKIHAGEIQVMSAGTGIIHSEKSPSIDTPVHLFQIWIEPSKRQIPPAYNQKDFSNSRENITLVVSHDGRDNSLQINQDINLYIVRLKKDEDLNFDINEKRFFWLQITKGKAAINGTRATAGDAIYGGEEDKLIIKATDDMELLLFDLN